MRANNIAEAVGENYLCEKLAAVFLTHQTVSRRVHGMVEQIKSKVGEAVEKCSFFSQCLRKF